MAIVYICLESCCCYRAHLQATCHEPLKIISIISQLKPLGLPNSSLIHQQLLTMFLLLQDAQWSWSLSRCTYVSQYSPVFPQHITEDNLYLAIPGTGRDVTWQQSQSTEGNTKQWPQPSASSHFSFIHHPTPKGGGIATFQTSMPSLTSMSVLLISLLSGQNVCWPHRVLPPGESQYVCRWDI